jgi:hypothetical protein
MFYYRLGRQHEDQLERLEHDEHHGSKAKKPPISSELEEKIPQLKNDTFDPDRLAQKIECFIGLACSASQARSIVKSIRRFRV